MRVGWKPSVEVGNDKGIERQRLRSELAETPYAENGTCGVGGREDGHPLLPD